jgi:hypothetical protein
MQSIYAVGGKLNHVRFYADLMARKIASLRWRLLGIGLTAQILAAVLLVEVAEASLQVLAIWMAAIAFIDMLVFWILRRMICVDEIQELAQIDLTREEFRELGDIDRVAADLYLFVHPEHKLS